MCLGWHWWFRPRPAADDPRPAENRQGLPFHFLDNVDPAGMSRLYDDLGDRLKTTLVIVVSNQAALQNPISA